MHCLSCQADPAVYSSSQFCPVETLILLSLPPKADLFVSPRLASCPVQPLGHGCFPGLDLQEHLLSTLQLVSACELTLHTPVPQGPPALYLFPGKRGQSSSMSRAGIVGNHQWTISHAEGVLGMASTPIPPAGCSSWTGHCKIALASAAALCAGSWVSILEKVGVAVGLHSPRAGRERGWAPGAVRMSAAQAAPAARPMGRGRTAEPTQRGAAGRPHAARGTERRAGAAAFPVAGAVKAFLLRHLRIP